MPEKECLQDVADEIFAIENVEGKDNFARLLRYVIDRLDPRSNMWTRRNPLQVHSPIDIDLNRDRFKILKACSHIKNSLACLAYSINNNLLFFIFGKHLS